MPRKTDTDRNDMLQKDLHEYIMDDLAKRFPGNRIISNQPLDHGLRASFAVEGKVPKEFTVLVEVKLGRPKPEDIMRASFYRKLIKGPKSRRIIILLYSPVLPSKVRELAEIADVELVELPERFFSSAGPSRNVKITGDKAWKVIAQLLQMERPTIRQASIRSGTSYGWAHAVFVQLQRSGIIERQGNAYVLVDLARLLDGLAWERPLSSLVEKEWRSSSDKIEEVLADIGIADKDAVITGYAASEGISGYSRWTDQVQVYSKQVRLLERQLGGSDKGIRVQVLRPDREIQLRQVPGQKKPLVNMVSMDQLILDLAGQGYPARDILMKTLDEYRGGSHG